MYKSFIVLCVFYCVVIEARPRQVLQEKPGYVSVYIRNGDTPLEEIDEGLAEAFHEIPAGRSAGKEVEAAPDMPEQSDQPQPESQPAPEAPEVSGAPEAPDAPEVSGAPEAPDAPEAAADIIDHRPYEKKVLEKKKKFTSEITKPVERR